MVPSFVNAEMIIIHEHASIGRGILKCLLCGTYPHGQTPHNSNLRNHTTVKVSLNLMKLDFASEMFRIKNKQTNPCNNSSILERRLLRAHDCVREERVKRRIYEGSIWCY